MTILAIETTAAACSVALAGDAGVIERFEPMIRGHAERLIPLIDALLAEAQVGYDILDLVAVATGPGTFTGLRIGLAAARGIALAADRPCLGISSFEVVLEAERAAAEAAWTEGEAVVVVLDSRRREHFAQAFLPPDGASMAPVVAPPALVGERLTLPIGLIVGPVATLTALALRDAGARGRLAVRDALPRAAALASVALRRWQAGDRPASPPDPIYLRAPETGARTAP